MKSFASDNYAGVVPEAMEALEVANENHAPSYGADTFTKCAIEDIQAAFETDAEVLFVFNGTGANVLSIAAATRSFNSVLCTDVSHIYSDESSAPETFSGCRIFPVPADAHGKLTVDGMLERMQRKDDVHSAQCRLISITQATEYGTCYEPSEIRAISAFAQENDLYLHMDGSRFFNAVAGQKNSLKSWTSGCGVDILSLGGTKAGMMYGEAVIVFNKTLAKQIKFQQKQVMQLASKTRFIAAQFSALMKDETWRKYALHANEMAKLLCDGLDDFRKIRITMPVEANAVFAVMPSEWIVELQKEFPFYLWNEKRSEARLMCAWDTTQEDVENFIAAVDKLNGTAAV